MLRFVLLRQIYNYYLLSIHTFFAHHSMVQIFYYFSFIAFHVIEDLLLLFCCRFFSANSSLMFFFRVWNYPTGLPDKTTFDEINFSLVFFFLWSLDDPMDTEILATAPKPGTSLRTATAIKAGQRTASSRPRTSTGRPLTGIARPGTIQQRAGTSSLSGNRTALQTGRVNTARNIRLGSASIFALADNSFNMSRLNPSIFAAKPTVAKILFQFLYYHEGDVKKALDLCNAVMELNKTEAGWWWLTQKGLILITFERLHTQSPLFMLVSLFVSLRIFSFLSAFLFFFPPCIYESL